MSALEIRNLESRDIGAALELSEGAGWNQTRADWQRLLALEPDGCFVAAAPDGIAGTVTTLRYGRSLAWLGMMLVDPRFRRRGIARSLMERAIGYLHDRGVETIELDATDAGRGVYTTLGFEDEHALMRCEGAPPALPEPSIDSAIAPITEADVAGVIALDRESFGVDRGDLLRSLWRAPSGGGFVQRDTAGVLQGFVLIRPGARAHYIGPWVAATPEIATNLLHAALGSTGVGGAFVVDIAAPCPAAMRVLTPLGFRAIRPCTRMRSGPEQRLGRPTCIYGISGFETG